MHHVLLLTAGLGTRLMPLTTVRAKPAVPVAGLPLASRLVAQVTAAGFTEIVCNLHHLPHTITRVLGDGAPLGARIRYSWEGPKILGSAGGPRLAFELVDADTLLIVNGDTLTDADLAAVTRAHSERGAAVTLALVPNSEHQRYGGVTLDASGNVVRFVPRGPAARGSFHFIGVQVAEREAFRAVPPGAAANSIGEVYDRLLAEEGAGAIRGVVLDASFWDVGTVGDYYRTSAAFTRNSEASWETGARSAVHPTAHCTRSIVWDDVEVGEGAELVECIVTDGVRIPAGAQYRRMVLTAGGDGQSLLATPFDLPGGA